MVSGKAKLLFGHRICVCDKCTEQLLVWLFSSSQVASHDLVQLYERQFWQMIYSHNEFELTHHTSPSLGAACCLANSSSRYFLSSSGLYSSTLTLSVNSLPLTPSNF